MCNQHLEVYNNYHHKYFYHTITKVLLLLLLLLCPLLVINRFDKYWRNRDDIIMSSNILDAAKIAAALT